MSWGANITNPPVKVGTSTVYYRGRGLLDGLFDSLLTTARLDSASEVLWSGCSAGGLTTYIHADWVTARLHEGAPHATVVALADAMFSLNTVDFAGDSHWPSFMQWVYSQMHSSDSVNEACVDHMAATYGVPAGNRSAGWRCMFGSAVAPFVQVSRHYRCRCVSTTATTAPPLPRTHAQRAI